MIIFEKNNESDQIWWCFEGDLIDGVFYEDEGPLLISFDKKKIYNLWTDYPGKLTPEEKEIFDKENPFWAEFFRGKT